MATEFVGTSQVITKVAAADLSALQNHFVKLDANGNVVPITATTDKPFGLLQNAPKSGLEALIVISSVGAKVMTSAAIAIGDVLGVSADGRVVKVTPGTDTTKYIVGLATKEAAAAANIYIQAEVACAAVRLAVTGAA